MKISDKTTIKYNEHRQFKLDTHTIEEIKKLPSRAQEIVKIDSSGYVLKNINKEGYNIMITFFDPTTFTIDMCFYTKKNLLGKSIVSIEQKNKKNYLDVFNYFNNEVKEL